MTAAEPSSALASTTTTTVAVVGAGPAGLLLAHLLAARGIDAVAVDTRTRHEIETTHRAGILEAGAVRTLVDHVSDRVLRDGYEHEGVEHAHPHLHLFGAQHDRHPHARGERGEC